MEIFLALLLVLCDFGRHSSCSSTEPTSQICLQGLLVWTADYLQMNPLLNYIESYTGLQFTSDANFIQSGEIGTIKTDLENPPLKPYTTLRYFPEGTRNCYNLPVEKGRKYLIKAWFRYGDYDRDIKPKFDLHLGPNLWATVNMQNLAGNSTTEEIIH